VYQYRPSLLKMAFVRQPHLFGFDVSVPRASSARIFSMLAIENAANFGCSISPMSIPIHVDAYSGYKANERPRQFTLDEVVYEIDAVLDQWYERSATYFKVQSTEGKTYLLRYDEQADEWTLQSGFDGDELLARPSIELVAVDSVIAKKAEQQIESCEHCHPADAEIRFDWLLAEVSGNRGPYEFVLSEPARCPNCKHEITEKTLVEPKH
jgi:hypothetical protein